VSQRETYMINSKHIFLITSALFFIGASISFSAGFKESEYVAAIGFCFSGLFMLMSVPWDKIKIPTYELDETEENNSNKDLEVNSKQL